MTKKIFLILFNISIYCYTQSERTVFYGIISDNLSTLPNAHILNTTSKKATFSLEDGSFEIFAKLNDSLKITSIGYKTIFIKVVNHHFSIKTNTIKLKTDVVHLKEVEIKSTNLSGILSTDAKKATEKPIISAETLKLPYAGMPTLSPAERKLNLAKGGSNPYSIGLGGAVSVDFIINSLSGRLKKAKMMKEFEDNENDKEEIINSLSMINYLKKDLGIDSMAISRFITFYQQDKTYRTNINSDLYFLEFLRKKSEEFKKLQKNK